MNWDIVEGNWEQFKGKMREKWGKFTDDDLEVVKGKWERLYGMMQERYGINRDEAERELDHLMDANASKDSRRVH